MGSGQYSASDANLTALDLCIGKMDDNMQQIEKVTACGVILDPNSSVLKLTTEAAAMTFNNHPKAAQMFLDAAAKKSQPACKAKTCAMLAAQCGTPDDGCGGKLDCGVCPEGQTCVSGKCQAAGCNPKTCAQLGASCGQADDGCGGKLECGACPTDQTCVSGECQAKGVDPDKTPPGESKAIWYVLGGLAGATVLGFGIWGVATAFKTNPNARKHNPAKTGAAGVPKSAIEWLVGRMSVGTPDAEVRADVEKRVRLAGGDEKLVRDSGAYALKIHHRNIDLYNDVMSGRIGSGRKRRSR